MNHCGNNLLNTLEVLFLKWPCHRDPEKSLSFFSRTMPICARCFGIIIGMPLGILVVYLGLFSSRWVGLIFIGPLLIDGSTQQMGYRSSNNFMRITTGFLAGLGLVAFILLWIERDLNSLYRLLG